MSYTKYNNTLAPSTPATGKTQLFVDSADKLLTTIDDAGLILKFTSTTAVIPIVRGGTGQITAILGFNALSPLTTRGDLLTRDATNNIRLAIGTVGKYVRTDGTDPSWSALLASDLSGTLTVAQGGTGAATLTGILQGNVAAAVTAINGTPNYFPKWSATAPYLSATSLLYDDGTNVIVSSAAALAFGSSGIATPDFFLRRNSANWGEIYNGTAAQSLSLYGTWTSAVIYERLTVKHNASATGIVFTSEALGGGTVRDFVFMGGKFGVKIAPTVDFHVLGDAIIKAAVNSAATFQVLPSASGNPAFNVDTTNRRIGVGLGVAPAYVIDVVFADATVYAAGSIVPQGFRVFNTDTTAGANASFYFGTGSSGTAYSAVTSIREAASASALALRTQGGGSVNEVMRLDSTGQVIISGLKPLCWGSSGVATPDVFLYRGAAALVGYGGTSASFPGLLRTGATLEFKLADNSAFAAFQGLYDRFGSGTPEAAVTAPVGSIFRRTDGGAGTALYRKETGAGNTGWVAVATSAFNGGDVADVLRVTGDTGGPVAGAGLEFKFSAAVGYITGYDRGASAYRNLHIDAGAIYIDTSGVSTAYSDASGLRVGSALGLGWASSVAASGALDTAWYRGTVADLIGLQGRTSSFPGWKRAAAVMECKLADDSAYANIKCLGVTLTAPAILMGYTVATLPAGTQGMVAFVTDALAPTFLATIVGGGAVVTPVFYDGTNWKGG